MARNTWLILIMLAAALGYCHHRGQPKPLTVGQTLPDISLQDLHGEWHSLSEYRGHRVLFSFWASWCGYCVAEMPDLNSAQAKYAADSPSRRGSVVIGIATEGGDTARAFVAAHPRQYLTLLANDDGPSTEHRLGNLTNALPYNLLVGADGRVLAIWPGLMSPAQLDKWLNPDSAP